MMQIIHPDTEAWQQAERRLADRRARHQEGMALAFEMDRRDHDRRQDEA